MVIAPNQKAATTASASVEAVQDGITRLEDVYERLNSFVYGSAEPPQWDPLMTRFRGALDQMKQGASEVTLLIGGL